MSIKSNNKVKYFLFVIATVMVMGCGRWVSRSSSSEGDSRSLTLVASSKSRSTSLNCRLEKNSDHQLRLVVRPNEKLKIIKMEAKFIMKSDCRCEKKLKFADLRSPEIHSEPFSLMPYDYEVVVILTTDTHEILIAHSSWLVP